jgi:hypothetical protein
MGLKIISITLSNNTGQPAMALALSNSLVCYSIAKVLRLKKPSGLNRIIIALMLGVRLLRGRNKYVVHLGLEGIIARCLIPLRGKVIFVNHGIYKFSVRNNFFRYISIYMERLGNIINDIFYVNRQHMLACKSNLFFQNSANLDNLSFKSRTIDINSNIGFVGPLSGQKNCAVLREAVRYFSNSKFFHMAQQPAEDFFRSDNYVYLSSEKRVEFFRSIDVLLIPSIYESYCLVAYEAAFCGIYVVHSGVDGLADFPYQSFIVKRNSPMAWIDAIDTVLIQNHITVNSYNNNSDAMKLNAQRIVSRFYD